MSTRIIIVWGKDKTVLGYAAYRTNSREGGIGGIKAASRPS
jgi:hypothetical protein